MRHTCINIVISKKSQGPYTLLFIWGKFAETFLYIKEQLSDIKFKIKFFLNIFVYFPKMHKTVFDLYKGKLIFALVSSQFCFLTG